MPERRPARREVPRSTIALPLRSSGTRSSRSSSCAVMGGTVRLCLVSSSVQGLNGPLESPRGPIPRRIEQRSSEIEVAGRGSFLVSAHLQVKSGYAARCSFASEAKGRSVLAEATALSYAMRATGSLGAGRATPSGRNARQGTKMGHGWATNPVARGGNRLQPLSHLRPTQSVSCRVCRQFPLFSIPPPKRTTGLEPATFGLGSRR